MVGKDHTNPFNSRNERDYVKNSLAVLMERENMVPPKLSDIEDNVVLEVARFCFNIELDTRFTAAEMLERIEELIQSMNKKQSSVEILEDEYIHA